jgi:hypothetical protein
MPSVAAASVLDRKNRRRERAFSNGSEWWVMIYENGKLWNAFEQSDQSRIS